MNKRILCIFIAMCLRTANGAMLRPFHYEPLKEEADPLSGSSSECDEEREYTVFDLEFEEEEEENTAGMRDSEKEEEENTAGIRDSWGAFAFTESIRGSDIVFESDNDIKTDGDENASKATSTRISRLREYFNGSRRSSMAECSEKSIDPYFGRPIEYDSDVYAEAPEGLGIKLGLLKKQIYADLECALANSSEFGANTNDRSLIKVDNGLLEDCSLIQEICKSKAILDSDDVQEAVKLEELKHLQDLVYHLNGTPVPRRRYKPGMVLNAVAKYLRNRK